LRQRPPTRADLTASCVVVDYSRHTSKILLELGLLSCPARSQVGRFAYSSLTVPDGISLFLSSPTPHFVNELLRPTATTNYSTCDEDGITRCVARALASIDSRTEEGSSNCLTDLSRPSPLLKPTFLLRNHGRIRSEADLEFLSPLCHRASERSNY
jgi:hypothetical protein